MNVESVSCGAIHCGTRGNLAELVGCGVIALAAMIAIEALVTRESEVAECVGWGGRE